MYCLINSTKWIGYLKGNKKCGFCFVCLFVQGLGFDWAMRLTLPLPDYSNLILRVHRGCEIPACIQKHFRSWNWTCSFHFRDDFLIDWSFKKAYENIWIKNSVWSCIILFCSNSLVLNQNKGIYQYPEFISVWF